MKIPVLALALVAAFASIADAQAATFSWDPVPGATAYEVESAVLTGGPTTWTLGAWAKVGSDIPASACVGTPVRCPAVVTPPGTGLALYRIVAKDAARRTVRTWSGFFHNEQWAPLGSTTNIGVQ